MQKSKSLLIATLITSYTNLATLKLVKHSSVQTLIHFTRTLLIFRLVIACMGVHESLMSLNVLIISFVFLWFRGPAHSEQSLPRTVCAFVNLTRDNIIEQYINTLLETPRPNVIQTACYCSFEKFRIKRYPNRPSLDYLLDQTKSTNHKIRKRKWT